METNFQKSHSTLPWLKYLVLGFNVIFMLTGLMVTSTGTSIIRFYYVFNEFLDVPFFSPASLLMLIGGFILFVTIIGFASVMKESTLMINTYFILLCLVFILQLSAGIAAISLRGRVRDSVSTNMNASIHKYPYDESAYRAVELIQKKLKCCGVNSPMDWRGIFPANKNYVFEDDVILPDSCCREFLENSNMCLKTNTEGCLDGLQILILRSLRVLFGCCLTLSIVQLTGMYFTNSLARAIVNLKSERIARQIIRRNQMQNVYDAMGMNANHTQFTYNDKPPSYDELRHYR